ncbi:hypothetical protein B7486_78565, partial [cyanobacterium TDX16]
MEAPFLGRLGQVVRPDGLVGGEHRDPEAHGRSPYARRMRRPTAATLLLPLLVGALGLAACSDDQTDAALPPDELAQEMCGSLVTWVNEISGATNMLDDDVQELLNQGSTQVSPEVEATFVGWVDEVEAASDQLVTDVDQLRFPPTERGVELADDLAAAAADARAE